MIFILTNDLSVARPLNTLVYAFHMNYLHHLIVEINKMNVRRFVMNYKYGNLKRRESIIFV
jgi:hypothetical protein